MSSSKGGGGIGGVGNSVVRSSSSDDEFPGVTIVPSNSGMRRQLLGATFKKAPLGDTDDELVDGFIEGRVEGRKMKTWNRSEPIYEQKKQEEEQQSRSRMRSRRQLQESSRFPWSMVVVVEERVPNSPGLLVGSPRNLCHLGNEIMFILYAINLNTCNQTFIISLSFLVIFVQRRTRLCLHRRMEMALQRLFCAYATAA